MCVFALRFETGFDPLTWLDFVLIVFGGFAATSSRHPSKLYKGSATLCFFKNPTSRRGCPDRDGSRCSFLVPRRCLEGTAARWATFEETLWEIKVLPLWDRKTGTSVCSPPTQPFWQKACYTCLDTAPRRILRMELMPTMLQKMLATLASLLYSSI